MRILFYVGESQHPFAARTWPCVPRAGDFVMLGPVGKRTPYAVIAVTWDEINEREPEAHCVVEEQKSPSTP